jgi:hypothetical protein
MPGCQAPHYLRERHLLLFVKAVELVEIEQVVTLDLSSIPIEHENKLHVLVLASDPVRVPSGRSA